MELLINSVPLDLSTDFAIEMEELNPFFSEMGAQSLPMQLPFTPRNLSLLGRPERIAHTIKLDAEHEAVIRHGMFQKNGKLHIFSAGKENGIDATFYINDGEFYTKIKDVRLDYINFDNPQYNPGYNTDPFTGTPEQKAAQWMQRFEDVQRGEIQAPYAIFPVCTKAETDENDNIRYEILNEPNLDDASKPGLYPLTGYDERTVNDVRCPVGYGVTPFLYLHFFLKCLFAHFGYQLQQSPFDTDPNLAKIVLLNNNADTICAGKLDYRQLLPDCSVTTFLNTLRNKFCCEFIPDGRTKTITPHFFEHNSLIPDMDLSTYVLDKPLITHEAFKQLRLSAGTALAFAQPAAETMEQLLKDYAYSSACNEYKFENLTNVSFNEIFFRKATGQFYKQTSNTENINLQPIGSNFFNYDKKTEGLEYDERAADDEQTPVIIDQRGDEKLLFPLIGERKHLNTGIKNKNNEETEENPDQTKIMFAFNVGRWGWLAYGTPFCYDPQGEKWGALSLQYAGNEGLFVRFWKKYDALLRHALRKITCRLQMPLAEFLKFNSFTPKLLNGTPVLPVSMKYTISRTGVEISEAVFYSLRLQLPYNLDDEQAVPPFNAAAYYWEIKNNINQLLNDNPDWIAYSIITFPPPAASFDAPTEQQYLEQENVPIGTFHMIVSVEMYDSHYNEMMIYEHNTDYSAWLEPRKKN